MSFNLPIPRGGVSRSTEVSRLISGRDPGSLGHLWKPVSHHAERGNQNTNNTGALQRQISKNANQYAQAVATRIHPFQIYQFPSKFRRFHNADDWTRFKVRWGQWERLGSSTPYPSPDAQSVQGTDSIAVNAEVYLTGDTTAPRQIPPSDDRQIDPNTGFWNEFACPTDGNYTYFWLTVANGDTSSDALGNVLLAAGDSPTGATDMYGGNTFDDHWDVFPLNDAYHLMIGYVSFYNNQWIINQRVSSSVYPTGMPAVAGIGSRFLVNFRGTYSGAIAYFYGDVVTKTETVVLDNYLVQYYYNGESLAYPYYDGPITGIDPTTNTPDPWVMISKSKI